MKEEEPETSLRGLSIQENKFTVWKILLNRKALKAEI
jgi:hypothetical protein